MGICYFFLYKSTYDPVKNINRYWISSHKGVESTSSNSSPYGFINLVKPTIGDKMSWDTSPKTGLFYNLLTSKGGNIAFPPPSHPCNVVLMFELPIEKKQTPQIWMEGKGEGQRFFCSLKLPYLSTMSQQFWRRLQLTGVCNRRERENKLITTCLFQSIVTGLGSSFSVSNSDKLVFPRTSGIEW